MKTNTIPVCSPLRLSMKERLFTGEVQLQWPRSKRKQKQALKKKKKKTQPVAVPPLWSAVP